MRFIPKRLSAIFQTIGPGVITGAADDDPSGVTTYAQVGAQFGLTFTWLSLATFPMMAIVQEMCSRLGLVTGKGLAANIRQFLPRWVVLIVVAALFVANTFNVAADLSAMTAAVQLLLPLPTWSIAMTITGLSLMLQIFLPYGSYAKYLKWLAFGLLAFVAALAVVKLDWVAVMRSLILPSMVFSRDAIILIAAVLGTTISPYLFFWNTSEEVEELKVHHASNGKQHRRFLFRMIPLMRVDVIFGMLFSNIVMFSIIVLSASTLYGISGMEIRTVADVASSLRPLAGEWAYALFTFGTLGTGFLAMPVLAGASAYAVSECFGWKSGLNRKAWAAPAFYAVILLSMGIAFGANVVGLDPVWSLIASAVLNGIVAAPLIFLIVYLTTQKRVMGSSRSGRVLELFGYGIATIMVLAGAASIASIVL